MPILTNGPSTVKGPRLTETIIFNSCVKQRFDISLFLRICQETFS